MFTDYYRSLLLVTIQKLYCNTFPAAPCCLAIQFQPLYCNTISLSQPPYHNTLNLLQYNSIQPTALSIAIQCNPCNTISILLQYKPIHLHTQGCNIILLLQYTSSHSTTFLLQYNFSYHNTIWAMAQNRFCTS